MDNARYFRDLRDGIIVIDGSGTIVEINPSAQSLLELGRDFSGEKYSALFLADEDDRNNELHQMVIDAVMEPETLHSREILFYGKSGEEKTFQVKSSFTREGGDDACVILSFTDITELGVLLRKRKVSSVAFLCITGYLCLWLFAVAVWDYTGRQIPEFIMSRILIYGSLIVALYCKFTLKLSNEECGLRVRGIGRSLVIDSVITFVAAALLVGIKLFMLKYVPSFHFYTEDGAFFDFGNCTVYYLLSYVLSVLIQEFVSRGIIHEQCRNIIVSEHRETVAIIISSLYFGAAHIHLGLVYMIGAAVLLSVLGIIYRKQGTIFGLCIPHFVLGELLAVLGFVIE